MKEFKLGQKVKIMDVGKHYSTYDEWAKKVGATYYKDHNPCREGEQGEIVALSTHSITNKTMLALVRIDKRDIIIDIEGIESIEDSSQQKSEGESEVNTKSMATYREVPESFKAHADEDSQALFRVGIINESFGVYSMDGLIKSLLNLNYKALAEQARAEIAKSEKEEEKNKKKG